MPKIREQSVPYSEHPIVDTSSGVNWEDVRVFLSVARSKSFRAAAHEIGLSFNTVRRHISRLERQTGTRLIARTARGIDLTREGDQLFQSAMAMEAAAYQVQRHTQRGKPLSSGRVRVTVTEGLGTFWLLPRLVKLQRAYPNIIIEINCTFREPDLVKAESDICIRLGQPQDNDLKAVRLGRMHVMPYAAASYLRTYGTPKSLKDVERHRIVEQLSPQLDVSAVDRLFPGKSREGFVSIVTNTSTSHFWAVAAGAGIGMLPTYLSKLGVAVVPVDIGFSISHDIWMAYHPDARRVRRIGIVLDFIKESFDRKEFPWFSDTPLPVQNLISDGSEAMTDSHFTAIFRH